MTNLTNPNNFPFMKYALKTVPGLADGDVLHGDGDAPPPELHPNVQGVQKKSND